MISPLYYMGAIPLLCTVDTLSESLIIYRVYSSQGLIDALYLDRLVQGSS